VRFRYGFSQAQGVLLAVEIVVFHMHLYLFKRLGNEFAEEMDKKILDLDNELQGLHDKRRKQEAQRKKALQK
jgi:hypothetical protein